MTQDCDCDACTATFSYGELARMQAIWTELKNNVAARGLRADAPEEDQHCLRVFACFMLDWAGQQDRYVIEDAGTDEYIPTDSDFDSEEYEILEEMVTAMDELVDTSDSDEVF